MAPKGKRDWLEPPEWWKKWKPLRWIVAVVLLAGVGSWVGALLPRHASTPATTVATNEPAPAEAQPAPAPARSAPAPATPIETPPSTPAPAPEPVPAEPAATEKPPTPGPASPETSWEENAPELADYTRVERDRLLMMDTFKSYDSVSEVQAQFDALKLTPALKSTHRKVHGNAPPYDIDSMSVPEFTHLGVTGKLSLSFFNNRLFEVEFEPKDPDTYLSELRKELPYMRHGEAGRSEYMEGHLRLASSLELAVSDVGRALHTRPYVLWQDRRLVKQRDDWDFNFSRQAE